jgi:predicted site-specific integrase-resolvase
MEGLTPLFKPQDVATLLGISVKGVHAECNAGRLEYVAVNGRKERRFTAEMVKSYIQEQTVRRKVVDKPKSSRLPSPIKKGGLKVEDFGTDLVREMRSLCR